MFSIFPSASYRDSCCICIQVWSNKVYKAAEHRVRARELGDTARYSAPFFYNPAYDTLVSPIKTTSISDNYSAGKNGPVHLCPSGAANACVTDVEADSQSVYRPVHWGDFRRRRFAGDYVDTGKEVQIEDYLV